MEKSSELSQPQKQDIRSTSFGAGLTTGMIFCMISFALYKGSDSPINILFSSISGIGGISLFVSDIYKYIRYA